MKDEIVPVLAAASIMESNGIDGVTLVETAEKYRIKEELQNETT